MLHALMLCIIALQALLQPAMGGMHRLGPNSPVQRWPTGPNGVVKIPFCYADDVSAIFLGPIFEGAQEIWRLAIGDPGVLNGHRLGGFEEITVNGGHPYCYTTGAGHRQWNNMIPPDTLVVQGSWLPIDDIYDLRVTVATIGYIPSNILNAAGRHSLTIAEPNNVNQDVLKHRVAAEIAHIFGLDYEHQRMDRDHYVKFTCWHLINYRRLQGYVKAQGRPYTMDEICASYALSTSEPYSYFEMPSIFFTQDPLDLGFKDANGNPLLLGSTPHGPFDFDSIMLFDSDRFKDLSRHFVAAAGPLIRWKNAGPDYKPPSKTRVETALTIPRRYFATPSWGDRMTIVNLYPWTW
ncbi:hypothetical protein ACN47E_003659 [Coniothyrium glycines]